MDNATIMQLILILWGVISLILSFRSFAWNRMIVTIEFWWCLLSVLLLILGFIRDMFLWCNELHLGIVLCLSGGFLLSMLTIFQLCKTVSMLVNRNEELTMQISLLNQENEQVLIKLGITRDTTLEEEDEEKAPVCD